MATTDTQLQQLVINVGTDAQIQAGIASGTITEDMLSIATDGADITYDWVGTLAEYNAENIATVHPDWLCFITDDVNNSGEDVYENVYSKTEANETFVAKVDNLPQYLPNLLEYKYTDHVLNNTSWLRANTFSWQSGKIYEAAYNHLVEDMQTAVQKQAYLKHNIVLSGNAKVTNEGVLNGFDTSSSYGTCTSAFTPTTALELVVKVKMPSTISSNDIIGCNVEGAGIVWRFSGTTLKVWMGASSWNICADYTCSYTFQPNNIYWLKFTWNGSVYTFSVSTDGINYTSMGTVSSTVALNWGQGIIHFGGSNWETYNLSDGSIDLKETYLKIDNNLVWKGADTYIYYEAEDKHCIALVNQESNIEYLYNYEGNSWYYILDIANQRFKLPRKNTRYLVASGLINNNNDWYRIYSDGWVEQGGKYTGAIDGMTKFGLVVPMRDTNYTARVYRQSPTTSGDPGTSGWDRRAFITNNYKYNCFDGWGVWSTISAFWEVKGYSSVDVSKYKNNEKYTYFYVGEFTQDAIENTAGLNSELFNDKADLVYVDAQLATKATKGHEVIDFQKPTSSNSYMWYRKYADGWVEQGQSNVTINERSTVTKTLPITMADTYYTALAQNNTLATPEDAENGVGIQRTSTTQIKLFTHYINPNTINVSWMICGMAA